jgi:predicted nucleotidyltransferase
LIGSVLTGHIREGSDIDLHVFSGSAQPVINRVEELGVQVEVERKRIVKDGVARVFTHVHVSDIFPIEITVYELQWLRHRFKSSITGKAIERATMDELSRLIDLEHHTSQETQQAHLETLEHSADRWRVYEALLLPLERVRQSPKYHPEGDALYHSLQVYGLAVEEQPYDEDFLLAALLHDIGKAIDLADHVAAGLEALEGFISERTRWLIAHHMEGHKLLDRTIGARRRRRLSESPWYEDLLALAECDAAGRVVGVQVDDVTDALDYIRQIETMFG